jgi:hypothetical protein
MVGLFLRNQAFHEDILGLLKLKLQLLMVSEYKINSLLTVLVTDTRVTASFTHHGDHSMAEFEVLLVGKTGSKVEGSLLVETGKGIAFEKFDVKQGIHDFICLFWVVLDSFLECLRGCE